MEINKLKEYANKLMFDMEDIEYETLAKEFDIILKQMDNIDKFDNISKIKPMTLPYDIVYSLRNDDDIKVLTKDEVLSNTIFIEEDQVKVPKVV